MAVGKGSMARAAKAAEKSVQKETVQETALTEEGTVMTKKEQAGPESPMRKTAKKGSAKKTTTRPGVKTPKADEKKTAKTVAAETVAAPSQEVMRQIVYQKSGGMLERDAKPNESFGLGDAMPVYYF